MPTVKDPPRRFALYLESRPKADNARINDTRQAIVIPSLRRASGVWTSPWIYSRRVSEFTSRSQWKKAQITKPPGSLRSSPDFPSYIETIEQQHLLSDEVQTPAYMAYMLADNHAQWVLMYLAGMYEDPDLHHMTPLFVEVTDKDVVDIFSKKTPSALMRRIERVRTEAGLPASVWVPHSTTGITPSGVPSPTPTIATFRRTATGMFISPSGAVHTPATLVATAGSGKI